MKFKGITKNAIDSFMVFADRNMINTVIRNLLGNALKYTEKGSISVGIIGTDSPSSK